MKKVLLAALVCTFVLIIWGMAFWGVLYEPFGVFMDEPVHESVTVALQEQGTETGTYFSPWPRNTPETAKVWLEKHTTGPFFKLSYVREGVNPQAPMKFVAGILHHFIVSLFGAIILWLTLPALTAFHKRVLVIFLAGCIGTLFIQLGDPVWFHLPWDYSSGALVYELVAWLIMGLVLGAMIKPKNI